LIVGPGVDAEDVDSLVEELVGGGTERAIEAAGDGQILIGPVGVGEEERDNANLLGVVLVREPLASIWEPALLERANCLGIVRGVAALVRGLFEPIRVATSFCPDSTLNVAFAGTVVPLGVADLPGAFFAELDFSAPEFFAPAFSAKTCRFFAGDVLNEFLEGEVTRAALSEADYLPIEGESDT